MGVDTEGMVTLEAAEAGIKAMEQFFTSIGMPTDIHTLIGKEVTDAEIEEMAQKCTNNDTMYYRRFEGASCSRYRKNLPNGQVRPLLRLKLFNQKVI